VAPAGGLSTTVTFEYGTEVGVYTDEVTASESPIADRSSVSANITGLVMGQTYYYRVKTVNSLETVYSSERSFVYSIDGAELWLDATFITGKSNGDTIGSGDWLDISGNSRTVQAVGTPVYQAGSVNSLPAVRFASESTGANSLYANYGHTGEQGTVIMVTANEVANVVAPEASFVLRSDANSRTYITANNVAAETFVYSKGDPQVNWFSPAVTYGNLHIHVLSWFTDSGTLKGEARLNGTPVQTQKTFSGTTDGTYMSINASSPAGGDPMRQDTIAVIHSNNNLGLSTIEEIEAYFVDRYS
jgi:hypothetical protein